MFVKVREVNEDLDTAMEVLQSNGIDGLGLGHFDMTYKTEDSSVKVGDLVIINVNHRRNGYSENTLGLVEEVSEEAKVNFDVKDVLGTVKYGQGIKEAQNKARKAELMQQMKQRAEQLNNIELMKKLGENDSKMKELIREYEEL